MTAPGGRVSTQQALFRHECGLAGIDHVLGGLDQLIVYLVRVGWLKPDQLAHYRQPAEVQP